MKVNRWIMPALALVLLVGIIGASQAAGLWASTGRSAAAAGLGQGRGGGGEGGEGGGTGAGATSVVKGWMTIEEAADASGLPVETVAELTGAADPASLDPATPLNQLESIVPGFTMSTFRALVADAAAGVSP